MSVPGFESFMLPLLRTLEDGADHPISEVRERIAREMALTEEDRDELLPSGKQAVFDNRLGWAKTYVEKAGLLTTVKRGVYRITEGGRRLLGWYLYYVRAGGVSEVVQVAARNGSFSRVLQRLLADAWRHGAAAVRGRLDPRHVQELSDRHCWFRREGTWTLVHSRHPDLAAAIHQGNAFLSRLEGEWWLRFQGG